MARWLVAIPVVLTALAAPALDLTAATATQLASHRAVYTMSLGTARSGSNTVGARGVMYLEWAEACDGWTVSQRVKLTLYATQGGEIDTDSNYSSWESKDGNNYRFTVRNLRNGKVSEEFRGDARLDGPGLAGKATFSTPSGLTFNLPKGSVFPTEHMVNLITAAQAGERRLSRVMFDGASIDGPLEVNAIIGPQAAAPQAAAPGATGEELTRRISWPVRMAFFALKSQQAEPEYEVAVRIHDNGVANHFVLDYGDFTVAAELEKMEALPKPKCE